MNGQLEKVYNKDLDLWGLPQEYKGMKFYPIKLKNIEMQRLFYRIFQYPKNNIPDKKILKMSYLKYLLYAVQMNINPEGSEMLEGLQEFLTYATQTDNIKFVTSMMPNSSGDFFNDLLIDIHIGNSIFNEQDFEIIRGIILYQNGLSVEYIEDFDPQLEELLKYVDRDMGDVTFEDQVLIFASLNQLSIKEVGEYTLYQFKRHFVRSILLFDYQLYNPLEVSGQIKSKNGKKLVKHYMEHMNERRRYDSILIPKEQVFESIPGIQNEKGEVPIKMPDGFD